MKPLRIVRIITRLNVGGPAYQAVILNYLLKKKYNHKTLLIYGDISNEEVFYQTLLNNYPCEAIFCKELQRAINPIKDFIALKDITKIIRQFKPDIVHTHTAKAGLIGRISANICKTKAIFHTYHGHVFQNYFSRPKEKLIITTERLLARKTDCLIAVSQKLSDELTEKFRIAPKQKFTTIELGLPLEPFLNLPPRGELRAKFNIPYDAILIGTLGRLVPIKNHSRLLDAFALLVRQLSNASNAKDIRLIIAGTGPLMPQLKHKVQKLKLTEKVFFSGLIDNLPQFYSDIDIAILTSDNEGTPVMLIEAQAAGKYIIAPDVGGISDIVHPNAGTVIRPNQASQYAKILTEVINNWNKYKNIPEQIRQQTVERFSADRLANEIENLYQRFTDATDATKRQ